MPILTLRRVLSRTVVHYQVIRNRGLVIKDGGVKTRYKGFGGLVEDQDRSTRLVRYEYVIVLKINNIINIRKKLNGFCAVSFCLLFCSSGFCRIRKNLQDLYSFTNEIVEIWVILRMHRISTYT
jgi:hypothetical protein